MGLREVTLPATHFRDVARAMLRHAFDEYVLWEPEGDWDTFLSWVDEEGGPHTRSARMRPDKHLCTACGRLTRDTTAVCDHCGLALG
jgi:hypothetical protein